MTSGFGVFGGVVVDLPVMRFASVEYWAFDIEC